MGDAAIDRRNIGPSSRHIIVVDDGMKHSGVGLEHVWNHRADVLRERVEGLDPPGRSVDVIAPLERHGIILADAPSGLRRIWAALTGRRAADAGGALWIHADVPMCPGRP
jgi:hypothetical protein